jgi:hypothetical protein
VTAAGRYGADTHAWWVELLGRLHDPDGPSGEHVLVHKRLDMHWPVGCYIAVEADTHVNYVGQVRRTVGGFAERFADQHQPVGEWHRVWLLPLRYDVAPHVVTLIEAMLIYALRPAANHVLPALALRMALR